MIETTLTVKSYTEECCFDELRNMLVKENPTRKLSKYLSRTLGSIQERWCKCRESYKLDGARIARRLKALI